MSVFQLQRTDRTASYLKGIFQSPLQSLQFSGTVVPGAYKRFLLKIMRAKVNSSNYRSFISLGTKIYGRQTFSISIQGLCSNNSNTKTLALLIMTVYDWKEINSYVLSTTGEILLVMTFERFGGS